MRELHAFAGRRMVGTFVEAHGEIEFEYAPEAGPTPISLSLGRAAERTPQGALGSTTRAKAAYAWLDNLLPTRADVRRRWARERGLVDSDPLTLLSSYGDDLAGAISLSTDPDLPWRVAPHPVEATVHDIATRIAAMRNQPTSWLDQRARPRFSLGGVHAKLALRRAGGRWLWPTYELPSTHIVTPLPGHVEEAVVTALEQARAAQIPAARAEIGSFAGQTALVQQRWDRLDGQRIHAETVRQALGVRTTDRVTAEQATRLMADLGLAEAWERQRALRGGPEAGAGDAALLLAGDRVALAPLSGTTAAYDISVPASTPT